MLPAGPLGFQGDVSSEKELFEHAFPKDDYTTTVLEKLKISFNLLPITFFARLVAALRSLAVKDGIWLNGAILSSGESNALLMEGNDSITISLLGENRTVRTIVLFKVLHLMETKFLSMAVTDILLSKENRKWSGDDIEEALLPENNGVLTSKKSGQVKVHSLSMLFVEKVSCETFSSIALLRMTIENANKYDNSQNEFLPLINAYLQQSVPYFNSHLRLPDNQLHLLWLCVRKNERFFLVPFSASISPNEPWMAIEEAEIQLDHISDIGCKIETDNFSIIRIWFLFMRPLMRTAVQTWELSDMQPSLSLDSNVLIQIALKEKEFFIQVGDNIFSKNCAQQARATKALCDIKVFFDTIISYDFEITVF